MSLHWENHEAVEGIRKSFEIGSTVGLRANLEVVEGGTARQGVPARISPHEAAHRFAAVTTASRKSIAAPTGARRPEGACER